MTRAAPQPEPPTVKGWCPGALTPMRTGDGLIVRVRPRCGAFSISQLLALSEIAERYGNGSIDLTRRANLQLRGCDEAGLPELWSALDTCGLIDPSPEAEAVRNVIVSPLVGFDPTQVVDIEPVAAALEQLLATSPALWHLPAKFGFIVDGGGMLSLDGVAADIRVKAHVVDGRAVMSVGIDTAEGTRSIGLLAPDKAAHAAARLAETFVRLPKLPRARIRDLDPDGVAALESALRGEGMPPGAGRSAPPAAEDRVGHLTMRGVSVAVGLGAPLGRLAAVSLREIADEAARLGIATLRVSPWRVLYAPVRTAAEAETLLATAARSGLVIQGSDPLLRIDACPGAPSCRSAWGDTRAAARQIAAQWADLPALGSVHVSGCAKGCARSQPADLVLVAGSAGFGIVRRGTAASPPDAVVAPASLTDLPAVLRTGT